MNEVYCIVASAVVCIIVPSSETLVLLILESMDTVIIVAVCVICFEFEDYWHQEWAISLM